MTSKSSFFKLMKEDLKIRIWTLAISVLIFFFSLIVATAMMVSFNLYNSVLYDVPSMRAKELAATFLLYIGITNPLFSFVFVVLALVMALSGFSYLYSKKKVDLYHSLPIKREILFFVKIINGILIAIVPFIICAIIAGSMILVNTASANIISGVIFAILEWIVLYILSYSVVVLAIMLTGNMLIGFLLCGFLSFYFPALALMIKGYQSTFFLTYYSSGPIIDKFLINFSSFMIIFNIAKLDIIIKMIISIMASMVLMFINLFLYKKRASETAGKSISFCIIKLPVKFMMVIFISMLMYLLAYGVMNDSIAWGIFGLAVGGVITHCIIEIIYNQDFKKIFAGKIQMLICIIISLILVAIFQMDIFGYDSYIPRVGDIKSAAVISEALESNESQYFNEIIISESYYDGSFVDVDYASDRSIEELLSKKMDITNKEAVLELAKKGVSETVPNYMSYGNPVEVLISYKLKSGRIVKRMYYIDYEDMISELSNVYADESYKKSCYPILSNESKNIVSVDFNGMMNNDSHMVFHDDKMKEKLVETYKKELLEFDYETKLKSYPFASIRFNDDFMEDALKKYVGFNYTNDSTSATNSKWDNVYADSLESVGYYPIYPEFKETLAVLKEMGVEVIERFPSYYVESIDISYVDLENVEEEVVTYSSEIVQKTYYDVKDIEEILDKLVICDSPYKDSLNEDWRYTVTINTKDPVFSDYSQYNTYTFKKGNIPSIIK